MKYKISCNSILLEKSLKNFLKEYLSDDGILITDRNEKNAIIIGKDIQKPFTKSQLLLTLSNINLKKFDDKKSESLEEKIEKLTSQFVKDLLKIIKENR